MNGDDKGKIAEESETHRGQILLTLYFQIEGPLASSVGAPL